jgi:tetraacyldisaccharide 4'-kinase
MERWLTRVWYENAAGAALLQPLSWLYGAASAARRGAFRAGWLETHRVERPVIIVGNLTVGGTGKTPLVAWLAHALTAHGSRVGIVSRGYGSQADEPRVVTETSDWREVGDEPVLLQQATGCNVIVSPDRVAAARAAIAAGADVIVCDDGLQHLRLARDCEIVVIDGARGFGNRRLLPAGPLREGAGRLARADLVVVNGSADAKILDAVQRATPPALVTMRLAAGAAKRVVGPGPARSLDDFRGRRVHAVAGIGNPARFFRELRERGMEVIEHAFPDHHPFAPHELAFPDELPILMTEKDAVRCAGQASPRMWYVPVTAELSEADAHTLLERVKRKLHAPSSATR